MNTFFQRTGWVCFLLGGVVILTGCNALWVFAAPFFRGAYLCEVSEGPRIYVHDAAARRDWPRSANLILDYHAKVGQFRKCNSGWRCLPSLLLTDYRVVEHPPSAVLAAAVLDPSGRIAAACPRWLVGMDCESGPSGLEMVSGRRGRTRAEPLHDASGRLLGTLVTITNERTRYAVVPPGTRATHALNLAGCLLVSSLALGLYLALLSVGIISASYTPRPHFTLDADETGSGRGVLCGPHLERPHGGQSGTTGSGSPGPIRADR